uniref:Uncharacterized protein n=1 Tax=Aegilops tauschii subsp. strangulata TaxID=200361 RepID=A0A453ASE4_AEGTS
MLSLMGLIYKDVGQVDVVGFDVRCLPVECGATGVTDEVAVFRRLGAHQCRAPGPHSRRVGRRVLHLRLGVRRPRRRPARYPAQLLPPGGHRVLNVPCRRCDRMRRRGPRRHVGTRDALDPRLPVPPGSCGLVSQAPVPWLVYVHILT